MPRSHQPPRRPKPTRDDDARLEALTAAYLAAREAGSPDVGRLEQEMSAASERRAEAILLRIGQQADIG